VKLLQDAFDRKHIHVRCSALVNDVSDLESLFGHFIIDHQADGRLSEHSFRGLTRMDLL
jgi:hypothetical protein